VRVGQPYLTLDEQVIIHTAAFSFHSQYRTTLQSRGRYRYHTRLPLVIVRQLGFGMPCS
jgi:hypothetical protein